MTKLNKFLISLAFSVLTASSFAASKDDLLFVEPSSKPTPKAAATVKIQPTSVTKPTAVAEPTAQPAKMKASKADKAGPTISSVRAKWMPGGVKISVLANRALKVKAGMLHKPERLWLRFPGAKIIGPKVLQVKSGSVTRLRMAQKQNEAWIVADLSKASSYEVLVSGAQTYVVEVKGGASSPAKAVRKPKVEPTPTPEELQDEETAAAETTAEVTPEVSRAAGRGKATLPKVDMMLFDRHVLFQGKQYDSFPCANLIYDKSDAFPLEREFQTTFVFYGGYGSFVCNLRLMDPAGNVLDQTKEPFAFNLFNRLTDTHIDHSWRVKFTDKGYYKILMTLNGEDVFSRQFYVGHSDDKP
jgi:hypothetical protein